MRARLSPHLTLHCSAKRLDLSLHKARPSTVASVKMEVISTAPTESRFTSLSAHQSQTPASFHSDPPVLHHRSPSTTILINSNDLESAPAFHKLAPPQRSNGSAHAATNEDEGHEITVNGLDIWVTSEY